MPAYLLDTHMLLWSALEPERLSKRAAKAISAPESILFLSAASIWELAIKHAKGALDLKKSSEDFVAQCIEQLRLSVLPIQWSDCVHAAALPLVHTDPFDRMIIQHAKDRSLQVLSVDPVFPKYGIGTVK